MTMQQTTTEGTLRGVLEAIAASRGLTLEAVADEARRQGYPYTLEDLAEGRLSGYGDALSAVLNLDKEERIKIRDAWMFDIGMKVPKPDECRPYTRHERPEPGGCVLRGAAATGIKELSKFGNVPKCRAGAGGKSGLTVVKCGRESVMEVYGLTMCEAHGEEAAAGALEEIQHDLDQELPRQINPYIRDLSPHLEAALNLGFGVLENVGRVEASYRTLVEAFPMGSGTVCKSITAYAEDPNANGRGRMDSPFDAYLRDRLTLHRHMRLAFEEGADWLVETLEQERVQVAAQAAYALALDPDLRPAERKGDES